LALLRCRTPRPTPPERYIVDPGDIEANRDGVTHAEFTDAMMKFAGQHPIIGRGVIVHPQPDDLKSQPTAAVGIGWPAA